MPKASTLDAWLTDHTKQVLDLCTGNGSLAVIAAMAFPEVLVDAADISQDALDVARINVDKHKLGDRIRLMQSDLKRWSRDQEHDLICATRPTSTARARQNCRPSTAPSLHWRWPAATTAWTWCGASCATRRPDRRRAGAGDRQRTLELQARVSACRRRPWLPTSAGDDEVLLMTREALVKLARHTET